MGPTVKSTISASRNALATVAGFAGRKLGFNCRQPSTTSVSSWGKISFSGFTVMRGAPLSLANTTSLSESPSCGQRPVIISKSITPSEKRSARASTGAPAACSGAM